MTIRNRLYRKDNESLIIFLSRKKDFATAKVAFLNIQVPLSLDLPIKRYEPAKICLILENRGKHPLKVLESLRKSIRIDPVILEYCERAHSNGNEKFQAPLPR